MPLEFAGDDAISKEAIRELSQNDLSRNPFVSGFAIEVTADKNGLVRIKTDSIPRGVIVLRANGLVAASIRGTRKDITTVRLTRQWEFLERYDVTTAAASFDFSETLRGDTDGDYRIDGYWNSNAAAQWLNLRINTLTTTLASEGTAVEGSTSATSAAVSIGYSKDAEASTHLIRSEITAGSGESRHVISNDSSSSGSSSSKTYAHVLGGKWDDSAVKITSAGLQASAGTIVAGSYFELYRKPKLDNSKLTLWVY